MVLKLASREDLEGLYSGQFVESSGLEYKASASIENTDGRTLNGMLAAETATSITLKRAEDASDTVLRAQIKRMRSGQVSIMPEGLEQQLDVQGMADLISYMMGAK